jgi:hypothetical protein
MDGALVIFQREQNAGFLEQACEQHGYTAQREYSGRMNPAKE